MSKRDTKHSYSHAALCYGAPVCVTVKFDTRGAKAVVKESERKSYCRLCVNLFVKEFKRSLEKELKELGLK